MKLFKSEIFDRRNGWGRNKLGQETTSVSFIYFAWNPIHKYGILSHQTYLSCSSMSRWKRHERERCQSRNSSQEPGYKVGFHREWLNMRHVVWGQDPAVMGSFITVFWTGTEKPRAEGGRNPNRTIVREDRGWGWVVRDQQSLRTGSELICLLSMEIWALMNRAAEPVLIQNQVSKQTKPKSDTKSWSLWNVCL